MKIERINENKIKVLIDDAEAKEWNVTLKKISENTPEAQRMFRRAITMARESIDFSIDGAKLFVEAIPSYQDGIGMLITKVFNDGELLDAVNNCSYKGRIRRSEVMQAVERPIKRRKYIYKFEDFDSVCAATGELDKKYTGISTLYKMGEEFYLYLIPESPVSLCEADILLSEFSERVPSGQYMHGRLNEYGVMMIEKNAIDIINEYF